MSSIIRNGVEFNGATTEDVTVVAFAEKAICDINGDKIPETYLKKEGFKKGGLYGASLHNSIYRGKDVTSYFLDGSLFTRISSGEFDDLYVGDYFMATINGVEITCRIAGFDIYLHCGDSGNGLTTHHAVIVPDEKITNAKINETLTTENGYKGSAMRQTTIPLINGYLQTVFGEHLITVRDCISNSVNATIASPGISTSTGISNSSEWTDSISDLMSEVEVFGTRVFSSSSHDIGISRGQFPMFRINPKLINIKKTTMWLRAVVSSTSFACITDTGVATSHNVNLAHSVRPRWIID